MGNAYKALLHDVKAHISHSRRGNCYGNVQTESLWARLKTKELETRERPVFYDLADTQTSLASYFDYYNHERHHSSTAYLTPYQFHQQHLKTITLNCPALYDCSAFR